ncbi:MAG TPA: hypothetical protein VLV86_01040 [Vicinamibacterales bacterium]|nr:hypothetical protein [Vicinamibacterales bacterium]
MGGQTERAAQILDRAHRVTAKERSDGSVAVHTYQDVEPHMEYAAKCRRADAEERGRFGKRGEMRRTMAIPFNILMEVSNKHHLNFFNPEDAKKILKIVKRDYPKFKTTVDKRI